MSNPSMPVIPPVGGNPDDGAVDEPTTDAQDREPGLVDHGDDRPLDPDLDDDQLNSADADERAAIDGTLEGDSDAGR